MLTGDIGQLRFYTTKLTAGGEQADLRKSDCKGPESDKAELLWLDYAPENIVTKGHAHHRVARNDRQCSKVYL